MKVQEAQKELNKFLQSKKGETLKEFKDHKIACTLLLIDEVIDQDTHDAMLQELKRRYFDVLMEQHYLTKQLEEAYHNARETNKKPPDSLIRKLIDLDHPENPYRQVL